MLSLQYDSKIKSFNNVSLSASSAISHELPPNDLHANIEDHNDDDVDLVIYFMHYINITHLRRF